MAYVKRGHGLVWSATRVNTANYCTFRYWLRYCNPDSPPPAKISAHEKGKFFHRLIEHFWEDLGTKDEFENKKKTGKKYYDPASFVKYAQNAWISVIMGDIRAKENGKQQVEWRSDGEKWIIRNSQIPNICFPLFEYFVREGPPPVDPNNPSKLLKEVPFEFVAGGKRFRGSIDEIRIDNGKVIVRDYKTGSPWMEKNEMKVKFDPQLTLYSAALTSMCYFNPKVTSSVP